MVISSQSLFQTGTSLLEFHCQRKAFETVVMNFKHLFLVVLVAALMLLGQTEAGGLKKLGKKLEGVGKRVFKASEKALPVITGYKAVGK
ncbi:cecropin-A1-like [Malaya genurostris]|uniref:cecropin-A1-like n=1 Tax=Malaya genurostris TaxID=325434 RepID=UPI0026F3E9F9|nr:cecropin-A1-like [Malaya genurostris]